MSSAALFENIHLLKTLVDKTLNISVRKQLGQNLPEQATVELREILFNVAVGNIAGFAQETLQVLSNNRQLVFQIVDANENLSKSEHQDLLSSPSALELLESVLPNILKVIHQTK